MKNLFQLVHPAAVTLLAIALGLTSPAQTHGSTLDVSVAYDGPGQVDEDHGLIVFVFANGDLGNPATPVLATRYLTTNGAKARFTDLSVDQVWLVAAYDETGGYSPGSDPLPGPYGVYSDTPGGPPTGVKVDGEGVELRFTDANRQPVPEDKKPKASFETLQGADGGIVEIRVYRIKPGLRDDFVRFFENTLDAQAEVGLRVRGQFRSLDDENTFVWIRTFRNQKERQEQARAFYLGPAWMGERNKEAAKYIESTEVMLVEPTALSDIR